MFPIYLIKDELNNRVEINFNGEFTEYHGKQFENFNTDYYVEHLCLPNLNFKISKNKKTRNCRFCKKSFPEVTFNKIAHLIPQLTGAKNFIWDEECDSCNHLLGKYENELAKFLGVTRTLSLITGQNGVPKFKNPDKKLIVQKGTNNERSIEIISEESENDHYVINKEEKTFMIKAIKPSYIPIAVYKSLLKVALSLLPHHDLNQYNESIKLLKSEELDSKLKNNPYLKVRIYFIPGLPFKKPFVILWNKRKDSPNKSLIPQRTLCIYFQTYMFQIFIALDENDKHLYRKKKALFKYAPPFIDKKWIDEFGDLTYSDLDLSSPTLKKGEEQKITLSFESSTIFNSQN